MSEKKVRQTLQALCDDAMKLSYDDMVLRAVVTEALAAEPDVVVVLRELYFKHKWAKAVEATGDLTGEKNTEIAGMVSALEVRRNIEWVERTFHVRLTDDGGWEWTE